jgi:hypothetical protein
MDERTEQELTELATSRAEATGKPVAVVAFVSSARMTVYDFEHREGELTAVDQGSVPFVSGGEDDPEAA